MASILMVDDHDWVMLEWLLGFYGKEFPGAERTRVLGFSGKRMARQIHNALLDVPRRNVMVEKLKRVSTEELLRLRRSPDIYEILSPIEWLIDER